MCSLRSLIFWSWAFYDVCISMLAPALSSSFRPDPENLSRLANRSSSWPGLAPISLFGARETRGLAVVAEVMPAPACCWSFLWRRTNWFACLLIVDCSDLFVSFSFCICYSAMVSSWALRFSFSLCFNWYPAMFIIWTCIFSYFSFSFSYSELFHAIYSSNCRILFYKAISFSKSAAPDSGLEAWGATVAFCWLIWLPFSAASILSFINSSYCVSFWFCIWAWFNCFWCICLILNGRCLSLIMGGFGTSCFWEWDLFNSFRGRRNTGTCGFLACSLILWFINSTWVRYYEFASCLSPFDSFSCLFL